jgi:hypothetical protein
MAASTRIKAQNILFKIGSTDYACDANMVSLTLEDAPGDVQTFCETRVGGQWTLELEGITSGDSTSLYRILWDNFGDDGTFIIAPYGNTTPTSDEPHYEGTVVFNDIPPLSLTSNETTVFSVSLEVKNTPHDPESDTWYGVEIVTSVPEE